ncbi:uncharacterized protein LOC127782075 [Oryza glaberrima]|uniref:uncharacterized protein LOC127782075 n=1 Tax=Oryza glaberrima TaxID=4538 RepID=UPI00224BF73F|nr:uncharacterized protein LOC127782075 [Oryza glaberrima]
MEGSLVDEQPVNEDGISVPKSLVDQIRRQRDLEVEEDDLYNDDDDDDTLGQYDSENECTIMIPNDDEPLLTDIEKGRAKNIMRIDQRMQQLGIKRLSEIVKQSYARKKPSKNRNKNDQLSESTELEAVAPSVAVIGTPSKRVLAPNNLEQTSHMNLIIDNKVFEMYYLGTLTASTQVEHRGASMGIELDSITRGLGTRIPVVIKEGKRRPEAPMQAAKLASEGGIIVRQHVPILTSWKEYKKDKVQFKDQLDNFIGKLSVNLSLTGEKENDVTSACADMLKGGTRQMRYRLKQKYFDGVPANQVRTTSPCSSMTDEQWRKLVDMWSNPKHKEKCAKLKQNRENVKFHQCTGSRSYIAAAYVAKQEKYKDTEPTAIDLFKLTHCSKTKGFSDDAKKAADDMEAILRRPVHEGEQEMTCTDIVAQVLTKSSTFLRNVGLQQPVAAPKSISPQMQELQAQLEAEKEESAGLHQKVQRLEAQAEESEAKAHKQAEEIENLKKAITDTQKSAADTQNLIRQMIAFGQTQAVGFILVICEWSLV